MPTLTRRFINWAAAFEDGALIRAAFFGLLTATAVILYLDYTSLSASQPQAGPAELSPILPAFDPAAPGVVGPMPEITTDPAVLRQPLSVVLGTGGVLSLTGTIDPGAADRVAAEIAARGEYIKTVALNSPGGAVTEALAIGQMLRDRNYSTRVSAGDLCASSCPLVLAGGKQREAAEKAAIGVHQIYAAAAPGAVVNPLQAAGAAMADTQQLTARIARYLTAMGVDSEMWLMAMETPPNQLRFFDAETLRRLKLATTITK